MEKLKIAYLGAGQISDRFIIMATKLKNVENAAIFSKHLENARLKAKKYNIPFYYDDYKKMLKEIRPDAVVITTPHSLHAKHSLYCLKAGAHILVEKPFTTNLNDAKKVYYASKKYSLDNNLPWDFIDTGVSKNFLIKEYYRALYEKITPDCKKHCHNCGLDCNIKNIENKDSSIIFESTSVAFSRAHVFNPVKIRVEFSKIGVLKYLSHLELIFVIHRAIRRAGIKLYYSKGFNPKPEISFGPPLGVGISGLSEYFDMKVFPPFDLYDNKDKLNLCLPEGININQMSPIPLDSQSLDSFISCYEYRISGGDILSMKDFLDKKEIVTKREKYVINLRAMVESAIIGEDNYVTLILKDLNEGKVRIGEILPIIFNTPFEKLSITRTGLYGWDNKWIKPLNVSHVPLFECKV